MEYTKCKLQYVFKAETELNLRINNHRKYVLKLTDWHFAQRNQNFYTDAEVTITEKVQNAKLSKEASQN